MNQISEWRNTNPSPFNAFIAISNSPHATRLRSWVVMYLRTSMRTILNCYIPARNIGWLEN